MCASERCLQDCTVTVQAPGKDTAGSKKRLATTWVAKHVKVQFYCISCNRSGKHTRAFVCDQSTSTILCARCFNCDAENQELLDSYVPARRGGRRRVRDKTPSPRKGHTDGDTEDADMADASLPATTEIDEIGEIFDFRG